MVFYKKKKLQIKIYKIHKTKKILVKNKTIFFITFAKKTRDFRRA